MRNTFLLLFTICMLAAAPVHAGLGARNEILAKGLKAVGKWLETHTLDCGWEDGAFMLGLATLQQATQDSKLHQTMLGYGTKFNWNMCLRLGGGAWNPDNQVCAATYADLYLNSAVKNETWVQAAVAHLDAEIEAASTIRNPWTWVDALFMAMSVYSRIGAATGKQVYFDKMHTNFVYSALSPHPNGYGFWSASDALFYRDPPKDHPDGVFWSRGNGWAAAALVQAMKFSPPSDPQVQTYKGVFKQHMARLVQLQGADGCWRSSLTNPDFYRVPETTGTALFTYAMAYGISEGILDAASYLPVVEHSWKCLTTISLHPDGRIGNCQPVGYAPQPDFGRNTTSSFCVGHFALAATAVAQLAL